MIEQGPADWQVIQRDARGLGAIALSGRWDCPETGKVEVRLVDENTGAAVNPRFDWQPAEMLPPSGWRATLRDVPSGGPYRLETHFQNASQPAREWSARGDMRHFLGVGDVWVIAGQSNSAGYGRDPVEDPPEIGVHCFANDMCWKLASQPLNDSTHTSHACNREGGNSGHAPWLAFGKHLRRALGCPIGLIQTSLGGSPLSAWNPNEAQPAVLFENMVRCAEAAGGAARGVLWYQGESDANPDQAKTYEQRFTEAVQAWRKALGNPALQVVTVQLNRFTGPVDPAANTAWGVLREAQRRVARNLAGVAVVPTLDLPLSDEIHTSSAGNLTLGRRAAVAALGLAGSVPDGWKPPEAESARRGADGKTVTVAFDHVASRIGSIAPLAVPFAVEDEDGTATVTQVVYPMDRTVVLELARPLRGRASVHCAPGANPPVVPMDMQRVLPVLAFHGLTVA